MKALLQRCVPTSLRNRLVALVVLLVTCLMIATAGGTYIIAQHQLIESVDNELARRAEPFIPLLGNSRVNGYEGSNQPGLPAPRFGEAGGTVTFLDAYGNVSSQSNIPVHELKYMAQAGGVMTQTETIRGERVRVLIIGQNRAAVQITRSLESTYGTLRKLGWGLILTALAVIALAFMGARMLTRPLLSPIHRLQTAMDRVRRSGNLDERIDTEGQTDEIGKLGRGFNEMLEELQAGHDRQARFIADASHELRTPATIVRGNVELLRSGTLNEEETAGVIADLDAESSELTQLLEALLNYERDETAEQIDLGDVVARVVERYDRHYEGTITVDAESTTIVGPPLRIERAVDNLVRNAVQWAESAIHVTLRQRQLTVDDDGPGIPEHERVVVFERFHRGESAKAKPGNGLGLAMVKDDFEAHGGSVSVDTAPLGGCRIVVDLPPVNEDANDTLQQ